MVQVGDMVTHKTFPPVSGVVKGVMPVLNGEPKLSVLQDNGVIYWDYLSTWQLDGSIFNKEDTSAEEEVDYIDVEFREV